MIRGIVQKMQEFQITRVLHIAGTKNPADHATRAPCLNSVSAALREDDTDNDSLNGTAVGGIL